MRFRTLKKWDDPAICSSFVYLAQLLDEMLFDFSLDTYKASVMHTGLLCREALQTIKEVEAGNIKAPNIGHVIAELVATFEKDPVALSLSPLPLNAFLPIFKNPKTPAKELTTVLELLVLQLSPNQYKAKNEELLMVEVRTGHSFPLIRRLARSYVTTLIDSGFSQTYLQHATKDFFCYGKDRIAGADAISDYFALFPKAPREFSVIFRLHDIFEHMAEAFAPLNIKVSRELPGELDLARYPSFLPDGDNKLYGVVSKIKAFDSYAARLMAEKRVKLCSTLISIFPSQGEPVVAV